MAKLWHVTHLEREAWVLEGQSSVNQLLLFYSSRSSAHSIPPTSCSSHHAGLFNCYFKEAFHTLDPSILPLCLPPHLSLPFFLPTNVSPSLPSFCRQENRESKLLPSDSFFKCLERPGLDQGWRQEWSAQSNLPRRVTRTHVLEPWLAAS